MPGIQDLGIQKVISFYNNADSNKALGLKQKLETVGIKNQTISCVIYQMNIKLLREATREILRDSRTKLINCHAGADRTGITVATLRKIYGEGFTTFFVIY